MRIKILKKFLSVILVFSLLSGTMIQILNTSNIFNVVAGTPDTNDPYLRFNTLLADMGSTSWPRDCKVDSSGNIFVTEIFSSTYKLKKYNATGTLLWERGTDGYGAGQFKSPAGLEVDSAGNVYVADYNGCRITKYSSAGVYLCHFGEYGFGGDATSTTTLNSPYDVTVNKFTGNVYVADSGNKRVVILNSNLQFVNYFSIATDFNYGESICLDASGNIYIGDQYNKTIAKYNSSGTKLTSVTSDDYYRITDLFCDGVNIFVSASNQLVKLSVSDLSYTYKWSINGIYASTKDSSGNFLVSVYQKGICKSRVASTNNNLSSITISGYTLSPVFDKNTINYTVPVESSVTSVSITPIAEDSTAIIKVNSEVLTSGTTKSFDIGIGNNSIKFNVTSESGETKVYTVNVNTNVPPDIIILRASDGGYIFGESYGTDLYVGDLGPGECALKFDISSVSATVLEATLNLNTYANWSDKPDGTTFVYKLYGSADDTWVGGTSFPSTYDKTIVSSDPDARNLDYSKSYAVADFINEQLVIDDECTFIISSDGSAEWICFYGTSSSTIYAVAFEPYLYIRIAAINKTSASFDHYAPADVSFDITVTDTLQSIVLGGTTIDSSNYTISDEIVTLKQSYLDTLTIGTYNFTINMTKSSSQDLSIIVTDSTPVITDFTAPMISSVTGNPTTWQNSNVTLTVSASDADTGIAATGGYSFDNGITWQNSNSKEFSSNTNGVIVKVKDAVGNIATYDTTIDITKIDKTGPSVEVSGNPETWQYTDAILTVTATDTDSGVASTAGYSFDNGVTWQDSNSKVYESNTNGIVVKVKDAVGNISTYGTVIDITKIDIEVPLGEIIANDIHWSYMDTITFGLFFDDVINVSITSDDGSGSGIKFVQYYISTYVLDSGELYRGITWIDYTSPFSIPASDAEKYIVYARIRDEVGCTRYMNTNGMVFDLAAPTITTNYTKDAASMEVTVTDSGCGIHTVTYTVDGGTAQTATLTGGKFTISSLAEGKYDVVITAKDVLGNEDSFTVNVVSLYTVDFKLYNGDTGEALKTEVVEYGSGATAPSDPTRTGFAFKGWDKSFGSITSDTTVNATWDINGITVTPYTDTYDSVAHNAVSISGTLAGDTITYSTDNSTYSTTIPQFTNADSYSVYVKVARTGYTTWESGLLTVTIERATGIVTITGDASKTYDGLIASNPAITKNSSEEVIFTYYTDNAGALGTLLASAPSAAGFYWVKATVAQDTNYTEAIATKQFTINRAPISGSVTIPSVIMTGDVVSANSTGVLPAGVTFGYQWMLDGTELSGETSSSYTVKAADYGKTLKVVLTANGNYTGSVESSSVTIDENINPTASIEFETKSWTSFFNSITFGLFTNKTVSVIITGNDLGGSSVKSIEYLKTTTIYTNTAELEAVTTWTTYTSPISITPEDKTQFIIYVRITDNAGNVTYINSNGAEFDLSAPSITTNYTKDATSMEVTIADNGCGIDTVTYTVDGGTAQTATLTSGKFTISSLAEGKYDVVITAKDVLGNESTLTVNVVSLYTVDFKLYNGDTGEALKAEVVEYGSGATAPSDPTRTGFAFKGWDKSFGSITSDTTVNATWDIDGIIVTPYTDTYDSVAHNAVLISGTLAGDTITYSTDNSTYSTILPQFTNASSYSVYVKVARTGYTTWESGLLTVVIERATGIVTITGDPSKTYDGLIASNPAITKNSSEEVVFTYYTDNAGALGTLLSSAPSTAATYWVKATVAQDTNYTEAIATTQFTISRAPISGSVTIPSVIMTGDVVSANSTGVLPAGVTFGYQWMLDGTALSGETNSSYTVKASDYGKTLKVVLTANGNYTGSVESSSVTIDENINPTASIEFETKSWTSFFNSITFGLFTNKTVSVIITGNDLGGSSVKSIEYLKTTTIYTNTAELEAVTTWTAYTSPISITPEDKSQFIIYVKVTDNAGNVTYINSNGAEFDLAAPTITTNYTKDATSMEVTVTDSGCGIDTVTYTVDGGTAQTATLTSGKFTISSLAEGKYDVVITAKDVLGNEDSLTVNVVSLYTIDFKLYNGDTGDALKTEVVEYGSGATAPSDPTRIGFAFKGWDKSFGSITSDTTVNATWDIDGIIVTPYTDTYDSVAHNAVSISGTLAGDTITYSTDNSTYSTTIPQFTNADSYSVYVKVARTGYTTWESGLLTVVIDKKVITTNMISIINSHEYTAQPITPVPLVKFGDIVLLNNIDYTVSYSNNTEVGLATINVSGKGNYSGTADKVFAIYAKNTSVEIVDEETPDVVAEGLEEIYQDEEIYTPEDQQIEQNGGTVRIELSVQLKTEVTEETEKIDEIASNQTIGLYLDLSLFKIVTKAGERDGTTTALSSLSDTITIVIPLPDDVKGKAGITLYRVHDGTAFIIPVGEENAVDGEYCTMEENSITLFVKNFSTYAIGYSANTSESSDNSDSTPDTGDTTIILPLLGTFLSFMLIVATYKRKKRKAL